MTSHLCWPGGAGTLDPKGEAARRSCCKRPTTAGQEDAPQMKPVRSRTSARPFEATHILPWTLSGQRDAARWQKWPSGQQPHRHRSHFRTSESTAQTSQFQVWRCKSPSSRRTSKVTYR